MRIPAIIGINIGQGKNLTAFAEVQVWRSYSILRLNRLQLGTPYPDIGEILLERLRVLAEDYDLKVRVNATGIGKPVINLLHNKVAGIIEVYLTGGYKEVEKEDVWILPKELMISHLKVLFQTNRISMSFEKPEPHMTSAEKQRFELFKSLKSEILNYETRVQVDPIHWNPETKTGEYDDLAIALGLACWPLA